MSAGASTSEVGTSRPWLAFLSVQLATCCAVLESTAVTVAVPAIAEEHAVSASAAIWVIGAPQILVVAMLLPLSALGDAASHRAVYLASLAGFLVTTLACALAPGFWLLVMARLAQSACVAGIMSVNFSLVRDQFSDKDLGKAIGMLAATVAVASAAGPAVSGFLLTIAGWRWIFWIMLPFGAAAFWVGRALLPRRTGRRGRLDRNSTALTAMMLGTVVAALYAVTYGLPANFAIVLALTGSGAALLLYRCSKDQPAPSFPFDLLRRMVLTLSFGSSVCAFTVQALTFVALPFLLLFHFGLTELEMALVLSIWPFATALIAPWIGRVSDRISAGLVGAAGLVLLAAGLGLLATAPTEATPVALGWRMAICGFGFSLFQTPNNRLVMFTSPRNRSGAASGMLALARQLGRAIGTAIAAATLITGNFSEASAALVIGALVAIMSAILSLARHRPRNDWKND